MLEEIGHERRIEIISPDGAQAHEALDDRIPRPEKRDPAAEKHDERRHASPRSVDEPFSDQPREAPGVAPQKNRHEVDSVISANPSDRPDHRHEKIEPVVVPQLKLGETQVPRRVDTVLDLGRDREMPGHCQLVVERPVWIVIDGIVLPRDAIVISTRSIARRLGVSAHGSHHRNPSGIRPKIIR